MFDNPKKELQRLEDELLAAEEIQWQESWERELEQPPEAASAQPEEEPEDHLCYLTKTPDGKILKSSSIYIRNSKGRVSAILSINYDI